MLIRPAVSVALLLLTLPTTAQDVPGSSQDRIVQPQDMAAFGGEVARSAVDLSAPPDFRGILDGDDAMREGKPYDSYTFDVREGTEVTVTMTSEAFDTYLVVRAPGGQEWTNDDFGDTQTSQVSFTPAARGTYTLLATAFGTDGRGAYEVRVQAVAATVVSTVSGRLDYQDTQQIKGEFYDTLTLRAPTAGEFYVDLLSLGFSGFLRVTSPGGVRTTGQQTQSAETPIRVGPFEGERGTWTVDVTTQGPGQVGAYDVRVITLDSQQ